MEVNISNQQQTGSWWDINKQSDSPKEEVKLDVFKLWLNHGVSPENKSYQYIVLPKADINGIISFLKKINISIICNTAEKQAVMNKKLNIIQAVFYQPGNIQINKTI